MFVRKAVFVSDVTGYGNFTEKDAVFKPRRSPS